MRDESLKLIMEYVGEDLSPISLEPAQISV